MLIYVILFSCYSFYINSGPVIILPPGQYNNDELIFLLKVSIQHFVVSSLIVIICYNCFIIILYIYIINTPGTANTENMRY
jgi:hypothetical protein